TSRRGFNTRYVVTNLRGCSAEWLYDHRYSARDEMENRIKEQQFLFSDRTSCHEWWPNQYRLLLSGLAYLLLERLRRVYLKRTAFAQAQVNTIRLKLLKIGAVITRNTRTIRLMLSSQYPEQDLFLTLASKLVPG
ncbi:transposase, partial [Halomonas sp. RA08-2]|uniref:transposase n=2 Tax=unclassified Halomonas TaxID=2609666 RepID=UPI003EE90AA0